MEIFSSVVCERFQPGIELIEIDDDPQKSRGETAQQGEIDVDRHDVDRGGTRRTLVIDDGSFIQRWMQNRCLLGGTVHVPLGLVVENTEVVESETLTNEKKNEKNDKRISH